MAEEGMGSLIDILCKAGSETVDHENKSWPLGRDLLLQTIPHIASHNSSLRNQVEKIMRQLATGLGWSVADVVGLVRTEVEAVLMGPTGLPSFPQASVSIQTGLLETLAFLCSLEPPFLAFSAETAILRSIADELRLICEADDTALLNRPANSRKALATSSIAIKADLAQLRTAAVKALSAFCSAAAGQASEETTKLRDQMFLTVFKSLTHGPPALQKTAFEALQTAITRLPSIDVNITHSAMRPVLLNLSDYKNLSLKVAQRLLYLTRLAPRTFNEKLCQQLIVHLKKWLEVVQLPSSEPRPALQPFLTPEMETCGVILDIMVEIPAATPALVDQLIPLIAGVEQRLGIQVGSAWRPPLFRFLARFPRETALHFLHQAACDLAAQSLLLWALKQDGAGPLRAEVESESDSILLLLERDGDEARPARELGVAIIARLLKANPAYLDAQPRLLAALRRLWKSPTVKEAYTRQDVMDASKFKAPKTLMKTLLGYFRQHSDELTLLFELVECLGAGKMVADFASLRSYVSDELVPNSSVDWKRSAFAHFLDTYKAAVPQPEPIRRQRLEALSTVLQHVVLPALSSAFTAGLGDALMGTPPLPDEDRQENLVSRFVTDLIDNCKTSGNRSLLPDSLHILLYQLSCLFVHHAPKHIHDTTSKKQGARLRKFMLFGWPCLQQNNSQDPTTKYHGHLLIAHIIQNFAINRKIVLQVFHSLLKAHGQDPRGVIKQALTILTPAVPKRMDDGLQQMAQLAKDIVVKDSHTPAQLIHLLNLIVRHYKDFYPVRHQLVQYLMNGAQKLVMQRVWMNLPFDSSCIGSFRLLKQGGTLENRKLAVEVWEIILKWELYRLKQVSDSTKTNLDPDCESLIQSPSNPGPDPPSTAPSSAAASRSTSPVPGDATFIAQQHSRPIDQAYVNQVVNYLLRMASQAPEQMGSANYSSSSSSNAAAIEALNKKCIQLLKVALKPDVWGYTAELKLPWVEKILSSLEQQSGNVSSVHMCLDVVTSLMGFLPNDLVVRTISPIQRGISLCLQSTNTSVVRSLFNLLSQLLSHLATAGQSLDTLDILSQCINKFVGDTLAAYEKTPTNLNSLYGAVTTLRALCTASPAHLDKFLVPFVKTLQKLAREHTNPVPSETAKTSADMLSLCLELIRPRIESMNGDVRKQFLATVLVPLVEKSQHTRVLAAVLKMASDWLATGMTPAAIDTVIRERHVVLVKLMQALERQRAPPAEPALQELHKDFLTLVLNIYRLAAAARQPLTTSPARPRPLTELANKLEPAFHRGLAHPNAAIRTEFLEVWESSLGVTPFHRLNHIMSVQNFEPMQQHYWIKQCIHVLLDSCEKEDRKLEFTGPGPLNCSRWELLPEPPKSEPSEGMETDQEEEQEAQMQSILEKQAVLTRDAAQLSLKSFVEPVSALCFADWKLSEKLWVELVPGVWKTLTEKQRETLAGHLTPFLVSGTHLPQKDAPGSTLKAFVEAVARLDPPLRIQPHLLKYLGKSHGLWHRAVLLLEEAVATPAPTIGPPPDEESAQSLAALCDLYQSLEEWDMWVSVWSRRARYAQTRTALAHSQHGQFTQASEVLEQAMHAQQQELATTGGGLGIESLAELELWEAEWARCMGELNQWEVLGEFASQQAVKDPLMLMETAWRVPNWPLMREALTSVERSCPADSVWLVHLYRGYLSVCGGDAPAGVAPVERCADLANRQLIQRWRRLPRVVAQSHVPVLLAAQRVMELLEASQLVATLTPPHHPPHRPSSLHDIKAVVKTWRNRTPNVSDRLAHWYDIFFWRLHHYDTMYHAFESMDSGTQQQVLLPMHSCAQCLVQLARVARKHNQVRVSLDLLNRLHTMTAIPAMDIFIKLQQQVKVCLRVAELSERAGEAVDAVSEGLEILDSANLAYLNKDQSAKLFALRGTLFSRLDKPEEASQAFSAALQLQDNLGRAWGLWGDHLLKQLSRGDQRAETARAALTAFLQAARQEHELKARKHIAKAMWLIQAACSMKDSGPLFAVLEKFSSLVNAVHWVPWVGDLLAVLKASGRAEVGTVLSSLGKASPQAVLLPLVNAIGTETFRKHWNDAKPLLPLPEEDLWKSHGMEVLKGLYNLYAPEFTAVLRIAKELSSLSEDWRLRELRRARALCSAVEAELFARRAELPHAEPSPALAGKIRETADGLREAGAEKLASTLEQALAGNLRLLRSADAARDLASELASQASRLPRRRLLSDHSAFLAAFSPQQASILLFGQLLVPKPIQYCVKIARFLPELELREHPDGIFTKLFVRGHNGKTYGFVLGRGGTAKAAQLRINRLLPLLNLPLQKNDESSRRLLSYTTLVREPVTEEVELREDEDSHAYLTDLIKLSGQSEGALVRGYYERLSEAAARNGGQPPSPDLLRSVFAEMSALCPPGLLKSTMISRYPSATDYFTARKAGALGLALLGLAEFALGLGWLGPGELWMCGATGTTGAVGWSLQVEGGKLGSSRPVLFRLSLGLATWLGPAVEGTLRPAMIAAARALHHSPQTLALLRPALWSHLGEGGEEALPSTVANALQAIQTRLQNLASLENGESKVTNLIAAAVSVDKLSRMDPRWQPWF